MGGRFPVLVLVNQSRCMLTARELSLLSLDVVHVSESCSK